MISINVLRERVGLSCRRIPQTTEEKDDKKKGYK